MVKRIIPDLWSRSGGRGRGGHRGHASPAFVGGLGLGAEVGYWYFGQRKVQNSADVAAYLPGPSRFVAAAPRAPRN